MAEPASFLRHIAAVSCRLMIRRVAPAAFALALVLGLAPWPASAQESRAEALARERAERARTVQPYKPGKIEAGLLWFERNEPLRKIAPFNGFYVQYGYTDKPVGSGIAFGGGYRNDLFGDRARIVFEAGASLRNYQLARVDFSLPYLASNRAEIGVEASHRRNPQEDFYGIGPDSLKADRVNFLYLGREIQARAVAKPWPWLRAGTRFGLINPSVDPGTDSRFPSLEEKFGDEVAPGLLEQPDFTYGTVFTTLDTRDQPGNARAGGYYDIAVTQFNDRDGDRYGFRRTDVDLQHFFPIFDKKRVIAVRGRLVSLVSGDGQEVPFYFQPTLGGSDSLRSYGDYRFRDRNLMFMNFEYRWEAFSGLDMALFSDWGQVARRARDLDLSSLKHGYGLGFRFNTYKAVFLRIDIASGGDDGIHYFLKFSKAF